jgi:ATP-dependent Clp protease adaptor protein ClpS
MLDDLAADLWPPRFWNAHPVPEFGFAESSDVLENLRTRVILYNDNIHTFDEVIDQVRKAIGCGQRQASSVAWAVHVHGKALIFEGEMLACLNVSSVLEEIELLTQVVT